MNRTVGDPLLPDALSMDGISVAALAVYVSVDFSVAPAVGHQCQ